MFYVLLFLIIFYFKQLRLKQCRCIRENYLPTPANSKLSFRFKLFELVVVLPIFEQNLSCL